MAEQSQDSSASTATSEATAGGVPGGGGAGAVGGVPVPGAQGASSALRVKAGLLAGVSMKALAKKLGLGRSTVQEHAKNLLLDGQLVKSEGRYYPGSGQPVKGGVPGAEGTPTHTPMPGRGTQRPAPPRRIDVATDGRRTFRVMQPPAFVQRLPGFVISKPKGAEPFVQMLHHIAHTDAQGRTWNLWLDHSISKHRWSLWVGKVLPPPRFEDFQKPGETPDDAFDRLTVTTVMEWAAKAGVGLMPVPRRSRPVAVTMPGTMPPGLTWRDSQTTSDGTPPHPNGWNTLELQSNDAERTRQHQEAHNKLPETTANVEVLNALVAKLDRVLVALAERAIIHAELSVKQETASQLRDAAGLSLPPKRIPFPDSGVDVS